MTQFKPFNDGMLVRPFPKKEKTESGIIIPDTVGQQLMEGEVVDIAKGTYALQTGEFMPTRLKAGNKVMFFDGQGMPMEVNGENLLYMTEMQILLHD